MLCLCPHPLEAVHLDLCTHKGWSRPRGRRYGGEGGSLCIFHTPEMCAKFCTPYVALQTLTSVLSAIPVGMARAPTWLEVLNAIAMKALSRGPWWTVKASRCLPLMYRMCFRNLYPSIAVCYSAVYTLHQYIVRCLIQLPQSLFYAFVSWQQPGSGCELASVIFSFL